MRVIIHGQLATLNEFINANNTSRYSANKIKQQNTDACAWCFSAIARPKGRCDFVFRWYTPNKRSDPDNIAFAKKFIFDGMVRSGFIENDGWKNVRNMQDIFMVDSLHPRVDVEIIEID